MRSVGRQVRTIPEIIQNVTTPQQIDRSEVAPSLENSNTNQALLNIEVAHHRLDMKTEVADHQNAPNATNLHMIIGGLLKRTAIEEDQLNHRAVDIFLGHHQNIERPPNEEGRVGRLHHGERAGVAIAVRILPTTEGELVHVAPLIAIAITKRDL